jgi:serine protease Do
LVYREPSSLAPVFSRPVFEEGVPAFPDEIPEPVLVTAPVAEEREPDSFYRETIKQYPSYPVKPRMSWRKRLILICLACTLGTGTLGLGTGAAVVFAGNFWFGGINRVKTGENLTGAFDYNIGSTRYVFSNADDAREGSLSDMVRLMEPSVVKVSSVYEIPDNELYQQYIGNENESNASGIIFREDAKNVYIATNFHVVDSAKDVTVRIAGSNPITAQPVGMNGSADLAVISVSKGEMKQAGVDSIVIAAFGDSDLMEVGDTVIAIGNALGEGNIATQGIISATEKNILVDNRSLTVLQTDAAINRGNSGGALFNVRGEVIGINSAKLMSYSVEGMGYSISSNIAMPILEDLMLTSSRPQLGIYGGTLTAEYAEEFGIQGVPLMGVHVSSVIPGMGAERAGIQADDIITGFNGAPVFTMEQLKAAIRECNIGDTVEVNVLRKNRLVELSVNLNAFEQQGFTE